MSKIRVQWIWIVKHQKGIVLNFFLSTILILASLAVHLSSKLNIFDKITVKCYVQKICFYLYNVYARKKSLIVIIKNMKKKYCF